MSDSRIRQINRLLELEPENNELLLELARLYNNKGEDLQVTRVLEKVVLHSPKLHQASFDLGLAYTRMKNFESALKAWERMVDSDGDLLLEPINRKTAGSAIGIWNSFLARSDGSVFTYYRAGLALLILKKLDTAAEAFEKVVTINGEFERVIYYRARTLMELKRPGEAIDGLNWWLGRNPQDAFCHYLLGACLLAVGRDRNAAEHFKKVVGIKPRHLKTRLRMAEAFLGREATEPALRVLEEALEVDPSCVEAFLIKAEVLEKAFRMDEAVWALECALKQNGNSREAHRALGILFRKLARNREAVRHLQKATQLDSDDAEGHYYLGMVLADLKQSDEAVKALHAAHRLAPGDTFIAFALSQTLLELGQHAEAAGILDHLLISKPNDRKMRMALGQAYLGMKQPELARAEFNRLLETNPHDDAVLKLLDHCR
ncbi:MAG: tetratricopeptide repeat protein [Vulcanimicrobiota bacterium]